MKTYKIMARILFGLFILSFFYGTIGIILSISGGKFVYHRPYIEYIKISLQCILGSAVLFLPSALEMGL